MKPPPSMKVPSEQKDWTEEHFAALWQWFDRYYHLPLKDARGRYIRPRSPLEGLSPQSLKALEEALEAWLADRAN